MIKTYKQAEAEMQAFERYKQNKGDVMNEQNETGQNNEQGEIVFKRYGNRKLYNTETSCYVTLGEIQALVKAGRAIRVIDNVSKTDITKRTLVSSLVDTMSESESFSMADIISLIKSSKLQVG